MRRVQNVAGVSVGCAAILAGLCVWAPASFAGVPQTASLPIPPGKYSGTVRMMGVNHCAVAPRCPVTLSGTWLVTVDSADHVRGSETMADVIAFVPGTGCSISPSSWTLRFNAVLGLVSAEYHDAGAPGFVRGSTVVLYVNAAYNDWTGWKGSPANYTRSCGSIGGSSWPTSLQYSWNGADTGWTFGYTAKLPIGLFENRGHPYTVAIKGGSPYHLDTFDQTYTLTSGPTS